MTHQGGNFLPHRASILNISCVIPGWPESALNLPASLDVTLKDLSLRGYLLLRKFDFCNLHLFQSSPVLKAIQAPRKNNRSLLLQRRGLA